MDAGGSAQLAVRDDLVIPWSGARSLSDVVVMSYRGVTIEPLPFRISPNADRVDDAATTVVRSPVAGTHGREDHPPLRTAVEAALARGAWRRAARR